MSQGKFIVFNPGRSVVSFYVMRSVDEEEYEAAPAHFKKRISRSAFIPVTVPIQHSVDLVKQTGLTDKEIHYSPDVMKLTRDAKLVVIESTYVSGPMAARAEKKAREAAPVVIPEVAPPSVPVSETPKIIDDNPENAPPTFSQPKKFKIKKS